MKVSIITVAYNSASTISTTIESVLGQLYNNIEYIIVDGCSIDNTIEIIKAYEPRFHGHMRWISEKDTGIYNAMNKGLKMATGEIIGILNSDDFYKDNTVLSNVVDNFLHSRVNVLFGNVLFVSSKNTNKIIRKYSAKGFRPWMFRWGIMPPHPSFFTRKCCYEKYGYYNETFNISGDYELMVRFLAIHKLTYKYLDIDMVIMRLGGASTKDIKSMLIENNKNVIRACRENGIYTNLLMISLRYIKKIVELIIK